jgi:Fe2+ transport system protein B
MSKVIEEKLEVVKDGDVYKYASSGIIELDAEGYKKAIIHLDKNINAINEFFNTYDELVKEATKRKTDAMNAELKAAKDSLENYDAYVEKLIEDIKSKKDKNIEAIKLYVDGFEKNLELELQKVNQRIENEKKSLTFQLENDTKLYNAYINANPELAKEIIEKYKEEEKNLQDIPEDTVVKE